MNQSVAVVSRLMGTYFWTKATVTREKKGVVIQSFRNRIKKYFGRLFLRYGEKEERNVTQSFLSTAAR